MASRRSFMIGAAGAVAKQVAASDRIRIAVLGASGNLIKLFARQPGVEVAMLCDPDRDAADESALAFFDAYGKTVRVEQDLRRALDQREIDVVCVAMPLHWRALAAIWACQSGKDVYLEPPGAHNVREGRLLVEAARRYGRIVQHGVEARSSEAAREGVDLLRRGVIGRVYMARGFRFRSEALSDRSPSSTFDSDLWQGPARARPHAVGDWRWYWDYGAGPLGEAIQEIDLCQWGLGVGMPEAVSSVGAKFLSDDNRETPDTQTAAFLYTAQRKMIELEVRQGSSNREAGASAGAIFYGSEGHMLIEREGFQIYLGPRNEVGPSRRGAGDPVANFLKAVRSRKPADQDAPVETAHASSALCSLANISHRLERRLSFDPATERFVSDERANAMLGRQYRAPFTLPERALI